MPVTNTMPVHEVLRELVGRCCQEPSHVNENLAGRLTVNTGEAVNVANAHHVEFGHNEKLFLQYSRTIPENDRIRSSDVYLRRRYDFEQAYLIPSLDNGVAGKGYYILRNMGWQGFQPYLDFFSELGVLQAGEKEIIQGRINDARQQPPPAPQAEPEDADAPFTPEEYPHNCIVFGAPGTGKSYRLNEEAKKSFTDANSERVTFYSTYSYAQFVGSYKPIMRGVGAQEKIAYQFVPGPFLRMLVKAANNPDQNYLLIIEEINRANAAAVFGDVFQLLDRTEAGESEYPVGASEDVIRYLNGDENGNHVLSLQGKKFLGMVKKIQEAVADDDLESANWTPTGECKLKLPKNLYIWATMNSADQGVFPLDTAFKRRWEFEYIGVNAEENEGGCSTWRIDGSNYRWNEVRKFINDLLSVHGVNEDKLMGPFFVKARQDNDGNYLPIPQRQFEAKVLMYLWEDAARMFRRQMFGEVKTYSQLLERWRSQNGGIRIFGQDNALGAEGDLRNRYNAFLNPPVQPNPPNGDPQPPSAGQP